MIDSKAKTTDVVQQWKGTDGVEQTIADDVLVHVINDRVYLSFGAVQAPVALSVSGPLDVKAVSRLVLTPQAFRRIAAAFNNVIEQLDQPEGKK